MILKWTWTGKSFLFGFGGKLVSIKTFKNDAAFKVACNSSPIKRWPIKGFLKLFL